MAKPTTYIAVTGHRDLRPEDLPEIKVKVKEKLIQITRDKDLGTFRLLSGMAEGADQLVVEIAREIGIPSTAILTVQNQTMELPKGMDRHILPDYFPSENEENYFEALGNHLLAEARHILVLWDGVYNGKRAGTSAVVKWALEGDYKLNLHHLVVPRSINPYPLASLLPDSLSFTQEKFHRIPFTVHFSWVEVALPLVKKETLFKKIWKPIGRKIGSQVFLSFVLPMLLVLSTLALGTFGFLQILPNLDFHNALFMAVNLITFNNSVIENTAVPIALNLARYMGLLTALSAFTIALYFALGQERRRLKLIFWQRFYPHQYVVVLGTGEKSFTLVKDLCSSRKKVVVVCPEENQPFTSEIQGTGAIWVKGSTHSASLLKKSITKRPMKSTCWMRMTPTMSEPHWNWTGFPETFPNGKGGMFIYKTAVSKPCYIVIWKAHPETACISLIFVKIPHEDYNCASHLTAFIKVQMRNKPWWSLWDSRN
ncbi:hypothetical protein [Cyclobacterium sp.]|uniref:hypothetical protein n=1 Tax=Cyclobacterium sp. TaxID=1966343 RepID=UPI0019837166|nr:hypothetical protein [Cyclobacterium sp.]MBD3628600.1 hypothetical protein [Cyclobacterium sp.]